METAPQCRQCQTLHEQLARLEQARTRSETLRAGIIDAALDAIITILAELSQG
jgi:hypothetical protein